MRTIAHPHDQLYTSSETTVPTDEHDPNHSFPIGSAKLTRLPPWEDFQRGPQSVHAEILHHGPRRKSFTIADFGPMIDMLRCGQSKKTFAATAKSGDARIHTLRTNRPYADAAIAYTAFTRSRGEEYLVAQHFRQSSRSSRSSAQDLKLTIRCTVQEFTYSRTKCAFAVVAPMAASTKSSLRCRRGLYGSDCRLQDCT